MSGQSNINFRLMALEFALRDCLFPRMVILKEAGIKTGDRVLDYGCGPGSYVAPASRMVGKTGKVYALDVNPLAIKMAKNVVAKKKLANIEAILSDGELEFPGGSMDVVLLYDVFHDLGDKDRVLSEIHRVLKKGGVLSFSDHHLTEDEIRPGVTKNELFRVSAKGKSTYSFAKI